MFHGRETDICAVLSNLFLLGSAISGLRFTWQWPALASVRIQDRPSLGHARAAALPTGSDDYRGVLIKHVVVLQPPGVARTFLSPNISCASTRDRSQLKTYGEGDWSICRFKTEFVSI